MLNAGTVLVAFADRLVDGGKAEHPSSMNHAVLGDFLTLVAAALYAVYTVLLKVMMPEDCESDMMAFFGYLGAINAVLFAPVLVIMQVAGSFDVLSISRATLSVALLKGAHRIECWVLCMMHGCCCCDRKASILQKSCCENSSPEIHISYNFLKTLFVPLHST